MMRIGVIVAFAMLLPAWAGCVSEVAPDLRRNAAEDDSDLSIHLNVTGAVMFVVEFVDPAVQIVMAGGPEERSGSAGSNTSIARLSWFNLTRGEWIHLGQGLPRGAIVHGVGQHVQSQSDAGGQRGAFRMWTEVGEDEPAKWSGPVVIVAARGDDEGSAAFEFWLNASAARVLEGPIFGPASRVVPTSTERTAGVSFNDYDAPIGVDVVNDRMFRWAAARGSLLMYTSEATSAAFAFESRVIKSESGEWSHVGVDWATPFRRGGHAFESDVARSSVTLFSEDHEWEIRVANRAEVAVVFDSVLVADLPKPHFLRDVTVVLG